MKKAKVENNINIIYGDAVEILPTINKKYDINKQKKLSHEFLFDITSVCNLNCTNCSVFCGLREPYFITVEEFKI